MSSFLSTAVFTVILFIISTIYISLVKSKSIIIKHKHSSVTYFNSIYISTIEEKKLRARNQCRGNCTEFFHDEFNSNYRKTYDGCFGKLHACESIFSGIKIHCQLCACLCERTFDPIFNTHRGELLDSFCLDPVSVDPGHVATGVRFKKHKNKIHIELQQGKLDNGELIDESVSWKSTDSCKKSQRVINNFNGWESEGFEVGLEDIILPANAVVTEISFTKYLHGKYLDQNKNIDDNLPGVYELSQCENSASIREYDDNLNELIDDGTGNFSASCNDYVAFKGSSFMEDYMQHVIPFINLREIVTHPPRPIRGIGWYIRTDHDLSELLSLRIF